MSTTTEQADFTLDDLWDRGVSGLQDEDARPGTTYEVAPGLVGEMPWPTLVEREKFHELQEELRSFFKEDATSEQFRNLQEAAQEGGEMEADESPIKEGITALEFEQTTARVNCRQTAFLLDFGEKEVEPHDIVPDMAAVVSAHFTGLRAVSNGQKSS